MVLDGMRPLRGINGADAGTIEGSPASHLGHRDIVYKIQGSRDESEEVL